MRSGWVPNFRVGWVFRGVWLSASETDGTRFDFGGFHAETDAQEEDSNTGGH